MHDQRIRSIPAGLTPHREDQITQSSVLLIALDLHPIQVTVSELTRRLSLNPDEFGERDRIERAVMHLAGVGLLHRHDFLNRPDSLVTPTEAAFCAAELLVDQEEDDDGDDS
jgi:hypothetical protein